jgi:hypothetical protein
MKSNAATFLAGCLVLVTAGATAQDTRSGVPGVLRSDGTFRPFVAHAVTSRAAGTEYSGKFFVAMSIKLATSFPEGTTIQCGLSLSVEGESAGGMIDEFQEQATVMANVSGSNATCAPAIPYEWMIYGSNDQLNISYTVTATTPVGVTRLSQGSLGTIGLPSNGIVTKGVLRTRI